MDIVLSVGDTVRIMFEESDGIIAVTFGDQAITVEADISDTDGREGVIYSERYGEEHAAMVAADLTVADCQHEFHEDPTRDGVDVCISCGGEA